MEYTVSFTNSKTLYFINANSTTVFHCHNLIHEDHDMMGAFNVTSLENFGYTDKTKFLDPMEDRWRAKPYPPPANSTIMEKLKMFGELDAYSHVREAEAALEAYYATATLKKVKRNASPTPPPLPRRVMLPRHQRS
jgi:bilirubin oxidase